MGSPLRASKARTTPDGASVRALSEMEEPTITTLWTVTGGEVIWNSPGQIRSLSGPASTIPGVMREPKPLHTLPLCASSAISRE